jgi:hypothetical protein
MNMMKYCPECYKELPPNSSTCPFCGYKTGNGDEHEPTKGILKTPQIDSYIPPEQTILSLLLLIIFFWGINLSITALPIYLGAGTIRNILIAAITSQVLTRALIGIWAVEEVSLKKNSNTNKKVGAFLLSFIPIGDIFSALHAARTAVRKNRLAILATASIAGALIMSLVLYDTSDEISALINGNPLDSTPLPSVAAISQLDESDTTVAPESTATAPAYINGCRNPLSVTPDEEGEELEICGKITNFGIIECEDCPLGFYSFVKIDGSYQIVSYEWRFTYQWLGKCVSVEDTVELLGEKPIFVYNKSQGCALGECITDNEGGLMDDSGVYFKPHEGCQ